MSLVAEKSFRTGHTTGSSMSYGVKRENTLSHYSTKSSTTQEDPIEALELMFTNHFDILGLERAERKEEAELELGRQSEIQPH